jgi:hypothetical protein
VAVDGVEAETHRDHREVGAARRAPGVDLCGEGAGAVTVERHVLRAEVLDGPAVPVDAVAQPFPRVACAVGAAAEEDEAVSEAGGAVVPLTATPWRLLPTGSTPLRRGSLPHASGL